MPRKTTEAAATRKPAARRMLTRRSKKTEATEPTVLIPEHIAERAYYIHLDAGGDPVENWLRAEQELAVA